MGTKIVTDSTCYIPEDLLEEFDISVVSLNVLFKTESFRELDIDKSTFYEKMEAADEIPTSSQPSIKELQDIFEKYAKNNESVIGVFLSEDMSGTYSSANLVKNMVLENYPDADIRIIDSRSNCMQMGFAALEGAKAAKAGESTEKIMDIIKKVINSSRFLFVPDNLTYLKKGGRIGGAAALLGNILQIKPILTVEDGKTTIFDKVRTKRRAVDKIVDTFMEDIKLNGLGDVIVHHINCEEEGFRLAEKISKTVGKEVRIQSIGPVIGLHVGPKAIGVAYFTLGR